MDNYIGITKESLLKQPLFATFDVAKATLQVYIPKNDTDIEIKNSADGLKKLYSKLKKQYKKSIDDIVFVYESTGSYSTILENYCEKQTIKCFKVGAYQSASRQHITALCGLDPIQRSSGTSVQHKERISKQGLSLVRAILFMPTMASIQHNKEMQLIYDRLVARGKPKPLAQIAVMRKIILLAHSLYKNKEQYDSKRYLEFTQIKKVDIME